MPKTTKTTTKTPSIPLEDLPDSLIKRGQEMMEKRYHPPENWSGSRLEAFLLDDKPIAIHFITHGAGTKDECEYLIGFTEVPIWGANPVMQTRTLYGKQQVFNHIRKIRNGVPPCRI